MSATALTRGSRLKAGTTANNPTTAFLGVMSLT
jgi:hypothetical protein